MRLLRRLARWATYGIALVLGLALLGAILGGDSEDGERAESESKPAPAETVESARADVVAAQAYRAVAEKDHSFGNTRSRVTLEIESELAASDVQALHTMMKAAVERHRRNWPDAVSVRLWGSYDKDSTIRNAITYAPDGCGWAGDDCAGALWTRLHRGSIPGALARWGAPTDAENKAGAEKACRQDLQCWGEKHLTAANIECPHPIERLAKYDHEWTDGLLERKLDRWRWDDRGAGTLSYTGDKLKLQNGFGAWQRVVYWCHFDPAGKVVRVSVHAR